MNDYGSDHVTKENNQEKSHLFDLVKKLEKDLDRLSSAVSELKERPQNEYHIYVEKMDVHSATLDELNFYLDKIDIKELSGAMNIGNTFGTKVEPKQQTTPIPEKLKQLKKQNKKQIVKKAQKSNKENKDCDHPDTTQDFGQDIQVFVNGKQVNHTIN